MTLKKRARGELLLAYSLARIPVGYTRASPSVEKRVGDCTENLVSLEGGAVRDTAGHGSIEESPTFRRG